MSSSAIGFINLILGPSGPIGPAGNQGPIGPDGLTSGIRGITGPNAPYITNVFFNSSGATVEFSDNSKLTVLGSFRGNTLTGNSTVKIIDYLNPNSDDITYSLLSSGNLTSNFIMRGISASGSLIVTEDSQAIYIDSIYNPQEGEIQGEYLTDNTLIYLKNPTTAASTPIGVTYGPYYTGTFNFEKNAANLQFTKLLPKAKLKYIAPTYRTTTPTPIKLNIEDAGVFYIRTPNGISEFTGNFKQNEVVSFTLITQSDDIWHFPSNVYFENGENYLTCGKSIVNLTSFDQGTSWYAVVAARGFDGSTFNCEINSLVGSCCYQDADGANKCKDFSNRIECNSLSGTFYPLRSCSSTCPGTPGACCSNGFCLDTSSIAECLAFGGRFYAETTCEQWDENEPLCFDPCGEKNACCKNGECIGDNYTSIECQNFLGGIAFQGKACSEVDCCKEAVSVGACCYSDSCEVTTLTVCRSNGGVFMGEGENCDSVNCQCITPPPAQYGSCCTCSSTGITQCNIVLSSQCTNGTFNPIANATPGLCPSAEITRCRNSTLINCTTGRCCKCTAAGGLSTIQCTDNLTQSECNDIGGTFTQGAPCSSTPACNVCNSAGCQCSSPGIKCRCVFGVRECQTVANISEDSDCAPGTGWSCTSNSTTCGTNSASCPADPSCVVVPGSKCKCVGNTPTCIALSNLQQALVEDPDCIDNPANCREILCSNRNCSTELGGCNAATPDTKCKCINSVRVCTQTTIGGTNPDIECIQNGGQWPCRSNTSCTSPGNACDELITTCGFANTCPPGTPEEHVACDGISQISILPCTGCTGGTTPKGSTFINDAIPKYLWSTSFAKQTSSSDPKCNNSASETVPYSGLKPLDLYIPIKSENRMNADGTPDINGKDARICIDIKLNRRNPLNIDGSIATQKNSVRVYVLRTFYPKYFSTNYAAMLGLTYSNGTGVVQYRNPSTDGSEESVWPYLKVSDIRTFSEGAQLVSNMTYYYNLSSFLTQDLVDYIPNANSYSDPTNSININTLRLIEELNCPLLGFNQRGHEFSHENPQHVQNPPESTTPSTGNQRPNPSFNTLANGYVYPKGASYDAPNYFTTSGLLNLYNRQNHGTIYSNDVISNSTQQPLSNPITLLPYTDLGEETSYSKTSYISRVRSLVGNFHPTEALRTIGYTDFGMVSYCAGAGTLGEKFYRARKDQLPDDALNIIGFYVENATLNRFANKFSNIKLVTFDNFSRPTPESQGLLPYRTSWIGHPITVDYESNNVIEVIPSSIPGGSPISVLNTIYDDANSIGDGTTIRSNNNLGFINSHTINTANGGSLEIKKSPVYKTRHTAIICDSGVVDQEGSYYPDANNIHEHNLKFDRRKRKVYGAVNNPWYDSTAGKQQESRGSSKAETIVSYTEDGLKLCITLKNYQDYVMSSSQILNINSNFTADEYRYIFNSVNPRNRRFLRYKDTIRVVIFPDAVNNFADQLSFPTFGNEFSEYVDAASKYINSITDFNNLTGVIDNFTVSANCETCRPNATVPAGECDACIIGENDKASNMYGLYCFEDFYRALRLDYGAGCSCCTVSGGRKVVRRFRCGPNICSYWSLEPCICNNGVGSCGTFLGGKAGYSVLTNCRNCISNGTSVTSTCTGRELVEHAEIPSGGPGTPPDCSTPCNPPDVGPTTSQCCDQCAEPECEAADTDAESCSSLEISQGFKIQRKAIKIKEFFDELGYVAGPCPPSDPNCADYWVYETRDGGMIPVDLSNIGVNDNYIGLVILFKLQPFVKKVRRVPYTDTDLFYLEPQELYSLDPLAPVHWMGTGKAYFRRAICEGSPALPEGLKDYGLPPFNGHLYQISNGAGGFVTNRSNRYYCTNTDMVVTKYIDQNLSEPIGATFGTWGEQILEHSLVPWLEGSPLDLPDHPEHAYNTLGFQCPSNISTLAGGTNYKKLFLTEDEFICVHMDCLSIDCSQYQDCVP